MKLKIYEYFGLILGLIIALESSYIHPDEHFQTIEPVYIAWYGVKGTTAWEFLPESASRSLAVLRMSYWPVLWLNDRVFGFNALGILYLYRLQNYLVYTVVVNFFLEFCEVSNTHKTKAKFFIRTSYVTWVFQSHTFSNSMETVLLLLVLFTCQYLLYEVRSYKRPTIRTCLILGTLISFGTFNRMTFPAFLVLPLISVFYHCFLSHLWYLIWTVLGATIVSVVLVIIDTNAFDKIESHSWVIAPWNNLLYNLNYENIAKHGIHSRYTHLIVNLPLLCGPLLIFFVSKKYLLKLPALSAISGLTILSLFQHQELRFIIPVLPLLCASIHLESFDTVVQAEFIIWVWMIFNVVLGLVYGVMHQAGIIPLISEFTSEQIPVHIWWKTYSPPTWLYNNSKLVVSTTNFINDMERVDNISWGCASNHVVDLKGSDIRLLNYTLTEFAGKNATVRLILPNTVKKRLESLDNRFTFTKCWETWKHFDFDHLDVMDLQTFSPGLAMYTVELL